MCKFTLDFFFLPLWQWWTCSRASRSLSHGVSKWGRSSWACKKENVKRTDFILSRCIYKKPWERLFLIIFLFLTFWLIFPSLFHYQRSIFRQSFWLFFVEYNLTIVWPCLGHIWQFVHILNIFDSSFPILTIFTTFGLTSKFLSVLRKPWPFYFISWSLDKSRIYWQPFFPTRHSGFFVMLS